MALSQHVHQGSKLEISTLVTRPSEIQIKVKRAQDIKHLFTRAYCGHIYHCLGVNLPASFVNIVDP